MAVRFSQDLADRICEMLAKGWTLRQVCREPDMPSPSNVIAWANEDRGPGFAEQYARARELGYQIMAEELVDIADNGTNDWMEREGEAAIDHEHVTRSRLRLDTRKWLLSKALPKIYGEKIQTQNQQLDAQGNPTDPVTPVINVNVKPSE